MIIYKITNTLTDKIYIGQTTQPIHIRWSQHKHTLNAARCNNNHLQRAWNKSGPNAFVIEVLGKYDTIDALNEAEIQYINQYNSLDPNIGYNIREGGNSGGKMSDATKKKLSKAMKGKSPSNKGTKTGPQSYMLRHQKSIKQRKNFTVYPTIVSPDGTEYTIDTVKGFCKEHNLYHRRISSVLIGETLQHRGWHLKETSSKLAEKMAQRQNWRLTRLPRVIADPNGISHTFTHLTNFCNQFDLHPGKISEVCSGKKTSYKGWKLVSQ